MAQPDTLRLTLDECITMARRQSVDAAVALGELRSAYWQWRSYKADLLPEVSLQGTLPSYNKRYSSYQQADGGLSFVRNDYLGLDGALHVTQKLWPTGGTLSVESSLDYLHQTGGCMGSSNVLARSDTTGRGPVLEYEVNLTAEGKIALGILPTQDIYPERGLRIGVQLDDQPMQLVDARHGLHDEFGEYTAKNLAQSKVLRPLPSYTKLSLSGWWNGRKLPRRDEVFDNIRWIPVTFATTAGRHTLRVIMVDPEIVLQQIVVNPDNNHYSYFGNK